MYPAPITAALRGTALRLDMLGRSASLLCFCACSTVLCDCALCIQTSDVRENSQAMLKNISLEYTSYHFYFKDWREKIKKKKGLYIFIGIICSLALAFGIYFSLILLNSYFAKLFEKLRR
jgi:hypothetical protein